MSYQYLTRCLAVYTPLAVLCLQGAKSGYAQQSMLEVDGVSYPRSRVAESLTGPVTEAEVLALHGQVVVPLIISGTQTLFVPTLSGSWLHVSVSPIDPSQDEPIRNLYDLDLNLVLVRTLTERWGLTLVTSPGMAGDFHNIDVGHLTLQLSAMLTRTVRPGLSWGLGGSLTNLLGESLPVPLVLLEWQSPWARANVLAPARAELLWTPGDVVEVGVAGTLDGNVYTLGRDGELRDALVRYSVIDVGPIVRLKLTPRLHLTLGAHASLRRRLEIEDPSGMLIQDATLKRGLSFQVGMSLLPPGDLEP